MATANVHASTRTSVRSFGWVGALVLAGVGLWCTRGLLDIVAGSTGVTRVAMLPPWSLLVALIVTLGVVGLAAARAGRDPDVALPLCALAWLAVPYLPWLPDRVPVLRAAAGPARYLVWLVVFWLVAGRGLARLRFRRGLSLSPLVIFVASVMIFGTVAWRLSGSSLFPGGDEPHYLVITQSLIHDGDLKIENNHQRGDYRAYFNGPLKPDHLALGVDGQIYSVHPVGLPVLAIVPFALGGYRGVVAMVILIGALAAALLWRWARETTGSAHAASFAWAAVALTAPYLFHSFTVYPEIPGALAVMAAVAWRTGSEAAGVLLLRGAAIGALPWLGTKYAPMAAAAAIVVLLRMQWKPRALAAFLAPIAVALVAWFAFFAWIWGTVSPSAPYGSLEPLTPGYLARGGPGLLFDQEYGIVVQAPILVAAFVGLAQMLRSGGAEARRALELILILGALLLTVGAFRLWWGGSASPGRPLASGVLLLGLPIASLFASTAARPWARAGCHVLLASSLAIACALAFAQNGALLHNDRDGSAALLEWVSPTWPLWWAFPSFIGGSLAMAFARTLAWLALGAGVAWLIHIVRPRGFGAAALATLVLGFAAASALVSLINAATAPPPVVTPEGRGRAALLDRFDAGRRPTAIIYDPFSRIPAAETLSRVTLIARPGLRTSPQPLDLLWNGRFALPAGDYRLRLTRGGAAGRPPDTTLALQVGRAGPPLERWHVAGRVWEHRFVLPLDTVFVGFRAPPDLSRSDGELQVTPVRVVDERRRVARPPIIGALRQEPVTVFFHDDFVFPEPTGYWTRGRARAQVTYATSGNSPAIDVAVRCGPVPNRVKFTTPGWEQELGVEPGAARRVAIPTTMQRDLGVRLAPVEIAVQDGFVPAGIDPSAADRRFLGCWVDMGRAR